MAKVVVRSVVCAGLVFVAGCRSSDSEALELGTSAISGGQAETGYPAVGCLLNTSTNPAHLCTGTLIAPNLVLSAKHCGPMTSFNTGDSCTAGGSQSRDVDDMIAYYPNEGDVSQHDLVLYHLKTPIYDVRPQQINPQGYPANGTTCVAVGFGQDGMGGVGTKRSGSVVVEWSGHSDDLDSAIRIQQASGSVFPPSGRPEHGDSGGPLFCNGTGVIRGVLFGLVEDDLYYTGIESTQTMDAAWVTNVASNYVNEPMISITTWGSSHRDMFVRGQDGAIWTKQFHNGNWYPSMTGWGRLGGFITGTPEAVSWGTNRIDVFMRGGDNDPRTNNFNSMSLHHLYWNGSGWTWQQMTTQGLASHPVAVSCAANRLDVFALMPVGSNSSLMYHWYSNDGTNWLYEAVPTDGAPSQFLPLMEAFSTSSGQLDLYAVGTDNTPYHDHYDVSGGVWSGWDWLGGQTMGTPAVAAMGGHQEIFFTGTDHYLYQKTYYGGTTWSPSKESYFPTLGGPIDGSVSATSLQSNYLHVASNAPSSDAAERLALKWMTGGTIWGPTANTVYPVTGTTTAGPPALLSIPGFGVQLFSMNFNFYPAYSEYVLPPVYPSPGFSGFMSLGGAVSW